MGKTGVFICHCGKNIAGMVDVLRLVDELGQDENLVVRDNLFMCSKPGQELIKETIDEFDLDRVVVASCSPMHHGPIFKRCVGEKLNPFMWDMANIREHCSWVHSDREKATTKAKALIRGAISRVQEHVPIGQTQVHMNRDVMVVGGGIAGMHASLELADKGFKVALVEKKSHIGGNMCRLDRTFPTDDCSMCTISPILNDVMAHENIDVYTLSEVEDFGGRPGEWRVKVKKRARFIDEEKCTGCADCMNACLTRYQPQLREPVSVKDLIEAEELEKLDEVIDLHLSTGLEKSMRRQRLIAILQDVNAMYNYLPENAIRYISERLEVPVSEIYHIATFFTAFSLTPRGRHIIKVCMGTACHVRGSPRILSELERQLGIKAGETTPDKMFTLETVNCLGACALGPVIVIDEAYHTAQPARITKLLESAQTEPEGTVAATEAGV